MGNTSEASAGEHIVGDLFTTHPLNARAMADAIDTALAKVAAERDALQKFKDYVHSRLDAAGVPADPESPHKAKGCRIGGRLDLVLAKCATPVSDDVLMDQWADRIG